MVAPGTVTTLDQVLPNATPVRFIAGKYAGKKGWIDPTRTADERVTPIIIHLAKKGGLYQTFVHNGSYRELNTDALMSYAEAVFQQPAIEKAVVAATRKLAQTTFPKIRRGSKGSSRRN